MDKHTSTTVPEAVQMSPDPKLTNPPPSKDTNAEVSTNNNGDYRPDLGEYNLVLVKDKDVPDESQYDPRGKLKYFPKGHLMGTNETFYIVTHRFADRAGINAVNRGYITVKADSRGHPLHPFIVGRGGAGGIGSMRESMSSDEEENTMTSMNMKILIGFLVFVIVLQYLYYQNKMNGI